MKPRRFSSRLLAWMLGLLAVSQAVAYGLVAYTAERNARAAIRVSLAAGADLFAQQLEDRMQELTEKAQLLAGDYALRQTLLYTEDAPTLRSALQSLRRRMGEETAPSGPAHIVLLDEDGQLLATTRSQPHAATQPVFTALVDHATQGAEISPTQGWTVLDQQLQGVAVVPVYAPEVVAWMGFVFPVGSPLLDPVKRVSRTDLAVLAPGPTRAEVVATTLSGVPEESFEGVFGPGTSAEEVTESLLGHERVIVQTRTLSLVDGSAVQTIFLRSLSSELAPLRQLKRILLFTGALALVGAALIAAGLARTISAPVRRLAEHTLVIAGGDYQTPLRIDGPEELQSLGRALNDMSMGLAERDRVRDLLDKNISPEVARQLLRQGAAFGGEDREVTILFADLRGFTSWCETQPPRAVLDVLNRYFTGMAEAIERHGGIIDKFIGDAIMAVFGAPLDLPDAPDRALRASLDMRTALESLNLTLVAEGLPALAFGIGINTAHVVAGRIGSPRRMNYSVIGDGVNVAARLQTLTRSEGLGTDILVSAATLHRARSSFVTRPLGQLALKGRSASVEVYALDPSNSVERDV